MAAYMPDCGAADCVMTSYLRDFHQNRNVQFHLAFALLVAVDCSLATSIVDAEFGMNLTKKILNAAYDQSTYEGAIALFDAKGFRSETFYSHFDLTRNILNSRAMGIKIPWMSGESLFTGLRLNFVCASGIPYQFVQELTTMLHMYWMLLSQGYLKRIPEIEQTLVRIYRKPVFFQARVPQKGQNAYLKSWQLALGVSVQKASLLDGRQSLSRRPRIVQTKVDMSMRRLMVTEISRLLDILQWKTMPMVNRRACFQEIQTIAKDEFKHIFLPPLADTCLKLLRLQADLATQYVPLAHHFGNKWIGDFSKMSDQMNNYALVAFWGFSLADDRTFEEEKMAGLSSLARSFREVFTEDSGTSTAEISDLELNPNTHEVDSALWGDKGVHSGVNVHV